MGDKATLAKASRELEDLYLGVPDESVNLTFKDLAVVKQTVNGSSEEQSPKILEPIKEPKTPKPRSQLIKLPSLDFSKGLQNSSNHHYRHDDQVETMHDDGDDRSHRSHKISPDRLAQFKQAVENSIAFDSVSIASMASTYQEKAQRRRPGIPHSNICTICSTYIYIFRHRCLVCGRVYCRDCVSLGMEEMTEGRKCVQCLGRRFSQRYIRRAGKVGWCSGYPSRVKQAELNWAGKGPKRSAEPAYGRSTVTSRSPPTPTRPAQASGNSTASFVAASSTFSPCTPNHHHFPL